MQRQSGKMDNTASRGAAGGSMGSAPGSTKKRPAAGGSGGFAIIEATPVFPTMFMVFLCLILVAIYLPQRAMLQRATQLAATAIAAEMGDTWVNYDSETLSYRRYSSFGQLPGFKKVYTGLFNSNTSEMASKALAVVRKADAAENLPLIANGELTVKCDIVNYLIYKEIVVTSTRVITVPVNFAFIRFPEVIELSVTAKATVKDGDGFVRNVDMGVSFLAWLQYYFGTGLEKVQSAFNNPVANLLF